jgi:hypothetical protein
MKAATVSIALAGAFTANPAVAQEPGAPAPSPDEPAAATESASGAGPAAAPAGGVAAPKPPYSLPWQLRPVIPGNVVRLDGAYAMYENKTRGESGSTIASTLSFSYKVMDNLAPLVRLGYVTTKENGADRVSAFVNPVIGALYGTVLGDDLKLGVFLGIALPVGQGGGNDAATDADKTNQYAAAGSGVYARSAMDNAMFAVNYLTVFPGVGLAYVKNGLTVQVEATVLSLNRARGDKVDKDKSRLNMTSGLHVGYFVLDMLSLGGEIRYQRWLSTPKAVEADEAAPSDAQRGLRDQASFAVGPRLHFKLGANAWIRPGIAYARGIDKPMSGAKAGPTKDNVIQLDVPVAF